MRAEHLISIIVHPLGRDTFTLQSITKLVNHMALDQVLDHICPYMAGSRLFGVIKKDSSLRPITVSNIFRRLTSKVMASAVAHKTKSIFYLSQLRVGQRNSCESIIHAVVRGLSDNPDKFLLQVDLINAYGQSDRVETFKQVDKHLPECLDWVLSCYEQPSYMFFGDRHILSAHGCQQGDPFSSITFALNLQPVLNRINREIPDLVLNEWFQDDGNLIGSLDQLARAVNIINEEGPNRGLVLSTSHTSNNSKSLVWGSCISQVSDDRLGKGIPAKKSQGIVTLGCPIRSADCIKQYIEEKISKVQNLTDKLQTLNDAQLEYILLRSCLHLPKVIYLLRTVDPQPYLKQWAQFDMVTREALSRILANPVTDQVWCEAKLPPTMGGLGLRSAVDHAPTPFITSVNQSHNTVKDILHNPDLPCIKVSNQLIENLITAIGDSHVTEAHHLEEF